MKIEDLKIEELRTDEAERLAEIRLRALRDTPDAFDSTYEENCARPPESWTEQLTTMPTFVAVSNGVDIGMARGARDRSCDSSAWLLSMWVSSEYRGQRIGERLIDAVTSWARALGMARLLLDVADDNASAVALYARKGFQPTGETGTLSPPREHVTEHRRSLILA